MLDAEACILVGTSPAAKASVLIATGHDKRKLRAGKVKLKALKLRTQTLETMAIKRYGRR